MSGILETSGQSRAQRYVHHHSFLSEFQVHNLQSLSVTYLLIYSFYSCSAVSFDVFRVSCLEYLSLCQAALLVGGDTKSTGIHHAVHTYWLCPLRSSRNLPCSSIALMATRLYIYYVIGMSSMPRYETIVLYSCSASSLLSEIVHHTHPTSIPCHGHTTSSPRISDVPLAFQLINLALSMVSTQWS